MLAACGPVFQFTGTAEQAREIDRWIDPLHPNGPTGNNLSLRTREPGLYGAFQCVYSNGWRTIDAPDGSRAEGIALLVDELGRHRFEYAWKHGVADGPCVAWDETGRVRLRGEFRKAGPHGSSRCGTWSLWNEATGRFDDLHY